MSTKLEEWIISLEKNQAKSEQYSRLNNIELSGIPNDIPENNLEKVVIDICHDSGLEIEPKDIEGCHRLPVSRYSRDSNKRVIVKFVNRKCLEALLRNKKSISSKGFSQLNTHGKVFVSVSICLYYRYIWGKWKDLQRRGKIYGVFCLGITIAIKVTERSCAMKIFHECDILDLDTDDIWKRLCLILFCKYRSVLSILFWNPSLFLNTSHCPRPFSLQLFLRFYHSTSLFCNLCIKIRDGRHNSINFVMTV